MLRGISGGKQTIQRDIRHWQLVSGTMGRCKAAGARGSGRSRTPAIGLAIKSCEKKNQGKNAYRPASPRLLQRGVDFGFQGLEVVAGLG